jgi:hypothetical protein
MYPFCKIVRTQSSSQTNLKGEIGLSCSFSLGSLMFSESSWALYGSKKLEAFSKAVFGGCESGEKHLGMKQPIYKLGLSDLSNC